jgi:hypothetical protein
MATVDPRYPRQIHTLWTTLDREITWLHGRWIIYRQLFGTNKERVELLNESAGTFFNVLQDVLLHDVQLSLSKLGDPAGSGSRENMTLEALHQVLQASGEMLVADKMKASMQKFETACVKIRHRRNKWIAHFDRSTMLNDDVIPRMGPSREEIENALEALREAMNCISLHYAETTIGYEHFSMQADGEALIQSLRRGLRYRELVTESVVARDDYRKRFNGQV